jgi:nicotinamide-nucleotide amidase
MPNASVGFSLNAHVFILGDEHAMQTLIPLAQDLAALLIARRETIAVAESSAGGLIAASLLAVPGASAYFLGGAVVYTRDARRALIGITDEQMRGLRSSSEPYAALLAATMREKHRSTWGLAETGAAGPSGNRYGDAAGHACLAINGPRQKVWTLETGHNDRAANMRRFAATAIEGLVEEMRRV